MAATAPENSLVAAMQPAKQFAVDSYRLVQKCTKPDAKGACIGGERFVVGCFTFLCSVLRDCVSFGGRVLGFVCIRLSCVRLHAHGVDDAEFKKIAFATTIGFLVMGFLGFFVKLIHIPSNNIIVGQ